MKTFKPHVWVNLSGDPEVPILEIRINCGTGKKIELPLEPQTTEDERLVLEYVIVEGSPGDPVTYSLSDSAVYDPIIHKKVTIKITDGGTLKGMCTVMPRATFFS